MIGRTLAHYRITVARHTSSTSRECDVTADGRRVLVGRVPEASRPREVRVVVNWFAELARLAGTRRDGS